MTYDEAITKTRYIKYRIAKLRQDLKKKENDYEELLTVIRGLDNVLDGFSRAINRDKSALNNTVFENNHSLKMFRAKMMESITTSNQHIKNIISASDKVRYQSRKTLQEINRIEAEIARLRRDLNYYQSMAYRILAEQRNKEV